MTHLKVAVRVRPLSQREHHANSTSIVEINQNTIEITNLKVPEQNAGDSRQRVRRFTFDHCFRPHSTQEEVFSIIGDEIEKALKKRYHSCVLAYGQSSTGKTHTMMGTTVDPGLTPRICQNIFSYLQETAIGEEISDLKTSVSYLEIYNEKVRDLLISQSDSRKSPPLKVREHPKRGPYVQGLSEQKAWNSEALLKWLNLGNSNRRVAATLSNPYSSRSHSVFTVTCYGEIQLHLVDLAGSERAGSRCPSTSILKEGANINKSLVALGNVISALAEHSSKSFRHSRKRFVPYRDSVLTWLLKDTLGGNSRTIMIATVSPSSACYNETVNTLRFGQRAKQIVSQPVVNEDPKEKTIRELRAEIARLKELLNQSQSTSRLAELHQDSTNISNENDSLASKEDSSSGRSIFPVTETNTATEALNSTEVNSSANETQSLQIPATGSHKSCKASENANAVCDLKNFSKNRPGEDDRTLTIRSGGSECYLSEKLIPLIDIKSTIHEQRFPSKNYSIVTNNLLKKINMEKKKSKSLGSQESLSSLSVKGDKTKRLSSTSSLRKRSLDKSNPSLKSSLRTSQETLSKVENSGDNKIELTKKLATPRKEIIESVTNRLYTTTKKKETTPETLKNHFPPKPEQSEKGTQFDSSTKMKLLELTRKALRAHRRKNVEIQTDLKPILRVKETSTDVNDLKLHMVEVKDAEIETEKLISVDVGVCCIPLDTFDQFNDNSNSLVLTRSCGTQSIDELTVQKEIIERKSPTTGTFSFTKYLQNSDISGNNQTFTSSLNINIVDNSETSKPSDNTSNDSLDDLNQLQMYFPTPDLISNHNSLETHAHATAANKGETNSDKPTKNIPNNVFISIPSTASEQFTTSNEMCVAACTITPGAIEKVNTIDITSTQAPEVFIAKETINEETEPFLETMPEIMTTNIIEVEEQKVQAEVNCPEILKSIMKQNSEEFDLTNRNTMESDCEDTFASLQDSLDLQSKKVRFTKDNEKNEMKMVDAMSRFLEEAAKLMTNLTRAANTLETKNNDLTEQNSYEFHVTVNDISGIPFVSRNQKRKGSSSRKRHNDKKQSSIATQTLISSENISIQTDEEERFAFPENHYESILKESCDRLERCVTFALENSGKPRKTFFSDRDEYLHRFPQPFSCHPAEWNLKSEDSSLESNPTFSDYGSLPRQRHAKRPVPSCSPSAYLKQLMTIRRQIVESSREDLSHEIKNDSF